jgi:hypothetical protein
VTFGSVRGVLVPSNENTEYFKLGQMARNEDTTKLPMFAPPLGSAKLWIIQT